MFSSNCVNDFVVTFKFVYWIQYTVGTSPGGTSLGPWESDRPGRLLWLSPDHCMLSDKSLNKSEPQFPFLLNM